MQEKEKGCNPARADMASQVHTLPGVPVWRGIYTREGEIRTTELYYKYREFFL